MYAFPLCIFLGMKCRGDKVYMYIQYHTAKQIFKVVEPIDISTSNLCVWTFESNDRRWPTLQAPAPTSLIRSTAGSSTEGLLGFGGISLTLYPRKLVSPLLTLQEHGISPSDMHGGKCSQ